MKTQHSILNLTATLVILLTASHASTPTARAADATEQEQSWEKLDAFNTSSLEDYLKRYSDSKHAAHAKLALELQTAIKSVKSGELKPKLVISFDDMGEHWTTSKQLLPDAGMLGLGYGLKVPGGPGFAGDDPTFFAFSPIADKQLRVRFKNGARMRTGEGFFVIQQATFAAFPAGHGSVIAYSAQKRKMIMFGSYSIENAGDSPVFFGVVEGVGLVHLKGKGTVTLPGDKKVELE